MSKNKILRTVIAVALILVTVGAVALYIFEITVKSVSPTKNLFRMLATVCVCIGGLIRLFAGSAGVRSLSFYEKQYGDQIKNAFGNSPLLKKKLLCAIRNYNENKFNKAIKYLTDLKPQCSSNDDVYAVNLFLALVLTDMGIREEAVQIYKELIHLNLATTTVYGNLGSLYSALGNYDDAIANLRLSIQNDENNPAPHQNLAKLYFDTYDFENAKRYAMSALKINHKFRQSATLLAVIYSIEGDTANAEKYIHIAISSGENPEMLKSAIEHYKTSMGGKNSSDSDT